MEGKASGHFVCLCAAKVFQELVFAAWVNGSITELHSRVWVAYN